MEKMAWDGPKWGQEDFFPTNPDLADILGRADLDFEIFYYISIFLIPNFWISGPQIVKFPDRGLGQGWAGVDATSVTMARCISRAP